MAITWVANAISDFSFHKMKIYFIFSGGFFFAYYINAKCVCVFMCYWMVFLFHFSLEYKMEERDIL